MIRKGNFTYRVKKLLKTIVTGKKAPDDYEWQFYADLIKEGIKDVSRCHTFVLNPGDYEFHEGRLELKDRILPLHPNYQIIYETLLQLKPDSVMDVGCGFGDSLHNINTLCPKIRLFGIDISRGVLRASKNRHPELNAQVQQCDIKIPTRQLSIPKVDIAFTQSVIMHMRVNHLNALANLFHIAHKQLILMENWKRHEFMNDITFLFDEKKLPWDNIYFYYRESEVLKKPHLMIISSKPLPQYPILTDYQILRNAVSEI